MKSVLIVDDSNTMRKIVVRSLRQAGQTFENIHEASDGREAIDFLEHHAVDLILCDINMPNMNGLEFLAAKKDNPNIQNVPVVMISTESGNEIIGEAKILGAKGAIKKPFTPEAIRECLAQI